MWMPYGFASGVITNLGGLCYCYVILPENILYCYVILPEKLQP